MSMTILMTVLIAGLGRGFLHALDPDHLVTVAALSSRKGTDTPAKPLRYALLWSAGHGVMIIASAILLIWSGQLLPAAFSASAESVVGVILICTGASVLWSLHRQPALQSAPVRSPISSPANGTPLLIGIVHGIAGSASLLALMPMALMDPAPRIAFAFVFCASVCLAMLMFALCFGRMQGLLRRSSRWHAELLQGAVGLGSLGLGVFWLGWG